MIPAGRSGITGAGHSIYDIRRQQPGGPGHLQYPAAVCELRPVRQLTQAKRCAAVAQIGMHAAMYRLWLAIVACLHDSTLAHGAGADWHDLTTELICRSQCQRGISRRITPSKQPSCPVPARREPGQPAYPGPCPASGCHALACIAAVTVPADVRRLCIKQLCAVLWRWGLERPRPWSHHRHCCGSCGGHHPCW